MMMINVLEIARMETREFELTATDDIEIGTFWWFAYAGISCFLVLFAGIMSGLTLGLMSLGLVELEILQRSGTNTEKKQAAQAAGFYDYQSFITASIDFQRLGFGTTGGEKMQMKEVAAFLGHVGGKSSCGYGVVTGGPLAWGLCYNREMSPSQSYCRDGYLYPCAPGAEYYGRGALPVYWNFNYGAIGDGLKVDLLNHPEYLEQNATIAFQAAMYKWMTPIKETQPSAHQAFVGDWKPTKNDTLAKRLPGFGTTMDILYGDLVCGQGDIDDMNVIISHYRYYLDLMGVGAADAATDNDNLSCAEQQAFNPTKAAADASS